MADYLTVKDANDLPKNVASNIDGDGNYVPKNIIVDETSGVAGKVSSRGAFEVEVQDTNNEVVNLYMQSAVSSATPTITSNASIGDYELTINDNTGIVNSEVITITEGTAFYQGIVISSSATTINLAAPLDFAFTTAASVDIGKWKMNVTGSQASPVEYCIAPPTGVSYDIYSINISLEDGTAMTGDKFGGIGALTNGIVLRTEDGIIKNHFLIQNNIGFDEYGYTVLYDDKLPTDTYRLRARKNVKDVNGTIIRLNGTTNDKLCLFIQDDLSDLINMSLTINGHVVEG